MTRTLRSFCRLLWTTNRAQIHSISCINETWYFLGQNVSAGWTLWYYCGAAEGWQYEGGLVSSVNKPLSADSLHTIAGIADKNGLDFSDWCTVDNHLEGEGCGP